jgi:drug/metabolite transporter (DMT)-like permease
MTALHLAMLFGLAAMASTKVIIQGSFGRKLLRSSSDAIFYNGMLFGIAAAFTALPLPWGGLSLSGVTAIYGLFFGLCSILFQFSYAGAFKYGSVALTVLISNCSSVIPIMVGVVFLNESLSASRAVGIIFFFLSFALSVKFGSRPEAKVNVKWSLLTLVCFCANGALAVAQKLHQQTEFKAERAGFVFVAYALAAVVSFSIYFILKRKAAQGKTFTVSAGTLISLLAAGAVLGYFQKTLLFLASVMNAAVLFPTVNSLIMVITTFCGIFLFKDRLSKRQMLGIVMGIVGIAFISL